MKNIPTIVLFLYGLQLQAQQEDLKKEAPDNRSSAVTVNLSDAVNPNKIKLPFRTLTVTNRTSDTTKCGYIWASGKGETVKLYLKSGSTTAISRFLHNYFRANFDSNASNSLLIVIRKLWLTRAPETDGITRSLTQLYFKAEVYLESENLYMPLFRLDTIFIRSNLPNIHAVELIEKATVACVLKAGNATLPKTPGRLALAAIDSFTARSRIYPVHNASVLHKGVYSSFTDFLNNKPAYTGFTIQQYKSGSVLYTRKTPDREELDISSWGFSDGATVYKRIHDQYFPLFRTGFTYETYVSKGLRWQNIRLGDPTLGASMSNQFGTGAGLIGMAASEMLNWIRTKRKSNEIRPVQLDMETGEFY